MHVCVVFEEMKGTMDLSQKIQLFVYNLVLLARLSQPPFPIRKRVWKLWPKFCDGCIILCSTTKLSITEGLYSVQIMKIGHSHFCSDLETFLPLSEKSLSPLGKGG